MFSIAFDLTIQIQIIYYWIITFAYILNLIIVLKGKLAHNLNEDIFLWN